MEKIKQYVILIPVLCAVAAISGLGYYPHVSVPITCMLIVMMCCRREVRPTAWLLVAALGFSIAGDWMLGHRGGDTMRFVYGIALFFIAHIGFLVFCLLNGRLKRLWLWLLLVGYGLFFIFGLSPAIPQLPLLAAVLLYMIISCFSLAAAAGLRFNFVSRWLFIAGIACLVFSDTLIALHEFMNTANSLHHTLMMPAYYAAHILVAASSLK